MVAAILTVTACGSTAGGPAGGSTALAAHRLTVGVIEIAQASLFTSIVAGFEQEMRHDLPGWKLTFQVQNAQGDPNLIEAIARQDAGSSDGMFAVLGTSAVVTLKAALLSGSVG